MSEGYKSPLNNRRVKAFITQPDQSVHTDTADATAKAAENTEISVQLTMIRKKHDQVKQQNMQKKVYLDKLKKELEQLNLVATATMEDQKAVNLKIEELENDLKLAQVRVDEELQSKRMYEHMLDRMKQEQTNLDLKSYNLQDNLKSARMLLETEKDRARKINEKKVSSRMMVKELRENLEVEKKKKDERIQQLELGIRLKKEAAERQENRIKRQLEIAEIAANEDRHSQEIKIKEQLILHKFWLQYLKWKQENKKQTAIDVEEAFQKIRSATGLTNLNDIVEKFLTREETYNQLLSSVSDAEKTLADLKAKHEIAREELKGLLLIEGEETEKTFNREYQTLEEEIDTEYKELNRVKEQVAKASSVHEQALGWGKKMLQVLGIEESKTNIRDVFDEIKHHVDNMIETVSDRNEEFKQKIKQFENASTSDLIKQLYTPEFITWNGHVKTERKVSEDESDK
ncbi:unnamed protein product [Blepharisma stoltei]|uniref:Uncharacterized protein n=1 Tax=Blepharisma stoltei TaxID=1481888 RepID=A0AAU9K506_9CILI|nr:unnamed protein product [Blepharisma stoltei]